MLYLHRSNLVIITSMITAATLLCITSWIIFLSAADNPFQPLSAIPLKAAEECTHVAIVVTARGDHIAFLDGVWPSAHDQYTSRLFVEFFTKVLFDEDVEFERASQQLLEKYHLKRSIPNRISLNNS